MPNAFLYRRRLTIHNAASSQLPVGFTIRVPFGMLGTLVQQNKVKSDYSDLRVIGDGMIGERDRIIDPANGPAPPALSFSIAASLDAGASTTVYALYYGSTTVGTPPANGSAVFTLYDDFTNGISNIWLKNDTASTSNGQLILHANHLDALSTNAAADKLPVISAVELVAQVNDVTSNPTTQTDGTFYYWFGYQHTGDFTPVNDPWIIWIARGKSGIGAEQKSPVGCEGECATTPGGQNNASHYYAIERDPSETRFYYDSAPAVSITVTNTGDYSPMVRNFLATSDVQIDYLRARARVSPDPTIALGAEESL